MLRGLPCPVCVLMCALLLTGQSAVCFGQNVGGRSAFEAVRPKLEDRGVTTQGDWVFAMVRQDLRDHSPRRREAAPRRARLELMELLAARCLDWGSIPETLGEAPAARLRDLGATIAIDRVSIAGFQIFESEVAEDGWLTVVGGIPSEVLDRQKVGVPDVRSRLIDRSRDRPLASPEAMLLMEIAASDSDRAAAKSAFAAGLSADFGSGVGQTLAAARVSCLPSGWRADPSPTGDAAVRGATLDDLLRRLGTRPHDAAATSAIAANFRATGWDRCAAAFEGCGLPVEFLAAPARPRADDDPLALDGPVSRLILETGGTFPFAEPAPVQDSAAADRRSEAVRHFHAGEFVLAAEILVELVEACPSADALSYLAACLHQLGMDEQGVAFARAAFLMKPQHPYAGVNLLRALRATDGAAEVRTLLPQVRANASLDAWGRRQVDEIERWAAEAAPR